MPEIYCGRHVDHLGDVCRHVEVWKASGRHLGHLGDIWKHLGHLEASGSHLVGTSKISGKHLEASGKHLGNDGRVHVRVFLENFDMLLHK